MIAGTVLFKSTNRAISEFSQLWNQKNYIFGDSCVQRARLCFNGSR